MAADQAGAALNIMVVLQAYQAGMLKELVCFEGLKNDAKTQI